ncbi:MAG: D-alanyl-D-alanine carboxypeptidase family protein [Candidatus Nomurabacteria bacterium]|nr:D-alanyl-D-alanine carboxypeptidase family protein [Candidatus Nomurabacteria bacterium]
MKKNKSQTKNKKLFYIFIYLFIFFSLIKTVSAITDTVYYFTIPLKGATEPYTSPYSDTHNVSKNIAAFQTCNNDKKVMVNSEIYGGTAQEKILELKKGCFYKILDSQTHAEQVTPAVVIPTETQVVTITPGTTSSGTFSEKVYNLLAPIGGMKTAPDNIGTYFNSIFNIAIGLCAVLAVIMIVIGGVQYMGNESIFGKTEAKGRIKNSILGLLIALGSYALLNTINPDLLGGGGVKIDPVTAGIEEEEIPILSDEGSLAPTKNSFDNCPGGTRMVQTKTANFRFCSAYAPKLQLMIADAFNLGGITLSGGGYRSLDEQTALRNKNCPAPKLTVPASSCKPQTAKPGTSNHEQGLAVDLKCNGKLINWDNQNPKFEKVASTKECFTWLQKNAINYGFKNLPKENWHWSTGPNAGH